MARGRKPAGPKMVDKLDASDSARHRLRVILETISGEKSAEEACQELAISEAMFYRLRSEFLQSAVGLLEPKTPGRKKRKKDPVESRIKELEGQLKELSFEAEAARIRTEIALTMPHLLKEEVRRAKKNSGSKKKRRKKRRK